MKTLTLSQHFFLLLLGCVTFAFVWILHPFSGAVIWAAVLAIVFAPLHSRLLSILGNRPNAAALLALLLIVLLVIVPVVLLAASLIHESAAFFSTLSVEQLDFDAMLGNMLHGLPPWALSWLERNEVMITRTLDEQFTAALAQFSEAAARHALEFGRNTFDFGVSVTLMLYLLFFLFRDGRSIAAGIKRAVPLGSRFKAPLFDKFVAVIRATVKGNVVVAIAQGALGGIIFWFLDVPGPVLWGALMAVLSLLPAVGAAIIWGPVAICLLLSGAIFHGVLLLLFGMLVIGLVDNILRPILVCKDTKLPDYLVLLSTLGGMVLFGPSGFVIGPVIAALFVAAWSLFVRSREFSGQEIPTRLLISPEDNSSVD